MGNMVKKLLETATGNGLCLRGPRLQDKCPDYWRSNSRRRRRDVMKTHNAHPWTALARGGLAVRDGQKIVSLENTKPPTPAVPHTQTMLSTPVMATSLQNWLR